MEFYFRNIKGMKKMKVDGFTRIAGKQFAMVEHEGKLTPVAVEDIVGGNVKRGTMLARNMITGKYMVLGEVECASCGADQVGADR